MAEMLTYRKGLKLEFEDKGKERRRLQGSCGPFQDFSLRIRVGIHHHEIRIDMGM